MTRTLKRGAVVAVVVAVLAAATVWAAAKPYQQDRILIELGLRAR